MPDASFFDRAYNDFDPLKPVSFENQPEWYVDMSAARGTIDPTAQMARQIRRQTDRAPRLLLLGHPGCGKSTELGRLRNLLEQSGWRCAIAETDRDLVREDLDLVEVMLLVIEEVGAELIKCELKLPDDLLKRLDEWFDKVTVVRELKKSAAAGLSSAADGEGQAPGLMGTVFQTILGGLRAEFRVSAERREEVRSEVRKSLRDFTSLAGEVIGAAIEALQTNDFSGLVVLVDGIEKASTNADGRERAVKLLLDHSESWAQLKCPLVMTAPLDLLSERTRLQNHYDDHFLLPAVPVAPRPSTVPDAETPGYVTRGREQLRKLVDRRAPVAQLFEDERDFSRLVERSGGSIRDLFRLLRTALNLTEDGHKVTSRAVDDAWRQHVYALTVTLQPEERQPLRALISDPGDLHYDAVGIGLLQRELVLPYMNGGRWFGVHPALVDLLTS